MSSFDPYESWLGVPPEDRPIDHYRLLGLPRFEIDVERIELAADERMSLIRRHQTGPRAGFTHALLNELAVAKRVLTATASKAAYDTQLIQAARGQLGMGPPAGPPVAPPVVARASDLDEPPMLARSASSALDDENIERDDEARDASRPWPWMTIGFVVVFMATLLGLLWVFVQGSLRLAEQREEENERRPAKTIVVVKADPAPIPADDPLAPGEVPMDSAGNVDLPLTVATLIGGAERLDTPGGDQAIAGLRGPEDGASWKFRAISAGYYTLEYTYQVVPGAKGKITVELQGEARAVPLRTPNTEEGSSKRKDGDDPADTFVDRTTLAVKKKGTQTLTIRPATTRLGKEVLRLKSVIIRRVAPLAQ